MARAQGATRSKRASTKPAKVTAPRAASDAGDGTVGPLRDAIQRLTARFAGVERRKVLQSDGWFANDRLFATVSRDARVVVRLPDAAAQDDLLAIAGTEMWRIGKKPPMRAWLMLPKAMHADDKAMSTWLRRAFALTSPAKKR